MHAAVALGHALGEGAGPVVHVPVEGLGEDQPLRGLEPERMHVGDEQQQRGQLWPPSTMPNSAACLIELMVSPPALARPITFAPEPCAWSRKEEKSAVLSG